MRSKSFEMVQLAFRHGHARCIHTNQGGLMKQIISAKFLAAGAIALGAFVAASAANAGSDVHVSIGVNSPIPVYVEPAPVYVQPQPVYVQPRPVYVQPAPVYVQPQPVYVAPRPVYVAPQPIYYGHDGQHWNE